MLDLLTHYPRRYLDRTNEADIADLVVGEEAMVVGEVRRSRRGTTRNRKTMVEAVVEDGTGLLQRSCSSTSRGASGSSRRAPGALFGKVESTAASAR